MDLVVRMQKYMREKKSPYLVKFVPDPICWTEGPDSLKMVSRQRNCWHRGLVESITHSFKMFLNPRYGITGLLAMPFYTVFEMLRLVIEISGYALFLFYVFSGRFKETFVLLFYLAIVFGNILSLFSILLEEYSTYCYPKLKHIMRLMLSAVLENLVYRQTLAFIRFKSFIDLLLGNYAEKRIRTMEDQSFFRFFVLPVSVFLLIGFVYPQELSLIEKAQKALQEGEYERAIQLCQEGLEESPNDYQLNFILARAYAFSGEYKKAGEAGDILLSLFPENTDVLLFMARLNAWDKNYQEAAQGYRLVLEIQPGNLEARIGLAELAAWQGKYREAVQLYQEILVDDQQNHQAVFRLGQVYLWQGNRQKAREYFRRALSLDPGNPRYQEALRSALSFIKRRSGLYYDFSLEKFSDKRQDYRDDRLVLELLLPENRGNILFKIGQTSRFNQKDYQYGLEAYPLISRATYGHFEFFHSSPGVHFPLTLYHLELYQRVLGSGELSLGYRRYNFETESVPFYVGSAGIYRGPYYAFLRCLVSSSEEGSEFTWVIQGRRYFSPVNFIYLGYGQGSRPVEIVTLEDFLAGRSSLFLAGGDWIFWQSFRFRVQWLFRKDSSGLQRNSLFLSLGYVF
ncbi:MAG: tetratricopeptide repeat protein [Candidatus Aminicenantes bacterium]